MSWKSQEAPKAFLLLQPPTPQSRCQEDQGSRMLGSLAAELPSPSPPHSDSLTWFLRYPQIHRSSPPVWAFVSGLPTSGACLPASPSPVSSLIPHILEILHSRILCSLLGLSAPPPLLHCTALDSAHQGTAHYGIDRLTGLPVGLLNYFFNVYYIHLAALDLSFSMGDLWHSHLWRVGSSSPAGIELEPPALGVCSLSHWREVPI